MELVNFTLGEILGNKEICYCIHENTLGDSYGSHDTWIFHMMPRDRTKRQNPPWPERLSSGEKSLINNIYGSTPRPYDSWIQQTTRALGASDSWKHYRSLHYPYGSTSLFYNLLWSVVLWVKNKKEKCRNYESLRISCDLSLANCFTYISVLKQILAPVGNISVSAR